MSRSVGRRRATIRCRLRRRCCCRRRRRCCCRRHHLLPFYPLDTHIYTSIKLSFSTMRIINWRLSAFTHAPCSNGLALWRTDGPFLTCDLPSLSADLLTSRFSRLRNQVGIIGSCVALFAFSFMWCGRRGDRLLHTAACLLAFSSALR